MVKKSLESMLINKSKTTFANHLAIFLGWLVCVVSIACFAVCGEYEDEEDYYGSSETCPFKVAVEGSDIVDPQDLAFLNAVEATRTINRWYARILGGYPTFKLQDIHNTSTGVVGTVPVSTSEIVQNLLAFSIIGGYVWEQWAMEGELFLPKKFSFSQNPLAPGFPVNATLDIQQFALFFNLEYIVPRLFTWYPRRLGIHLDAGAGAVYKITHISTYNLDGSPQDVNDKQTIAAAGHLDIGARYQVTPHILLGATYRFISLGKTNAGPIGPFSILLKSNDSQMNGWFYELTYQF